MVHARDEAHRFVNTYHRKRRGRSKMTDPLESVEGLGAKKMQNLLRHFGGRQGIQHASAENLMTVPGIGQSLAKRIYDTPAGSGGALGLLSSLNSSNSPWMASLWKPDKSANSSLPIFGFAEAANLALRRFLFARFFLRRRTKSISKMTMMAGYFQN